MRFRLFGWAAALALPLLAAAVALADPAPAPWNGQDIGQVVHNGGVDYQNGVFKINGSGNDVWGSADSFYFLSQPAGEQCTVVAHFAKGLQYVDPWAKAGLMIRASADPASPEAFLAVTSMHGLIFAFRSVAGAATVDYEMPGHYSTASGGDGEWLKLTRDGRRIVASISSDGINWRGLGTADVPLGESAVAGLAMSAHDVNQQYAYAWFGHVQVAQSVLPNPAGQSPAPTAQETRSADGFVDSIGVATHSYPDTTYGQYQQIIRPRLAELGIRHVRDGWDDRYTDLYKSFGIKLNMVAETPDLLKPIDSHPEVIDEVEGPNETDMMQWDDATHKVDRWFSYAGLTNSPGSYPATRAGQTAIYNAVKSDPIAQAHHIGVEMPTMANPSDTPNLAPLTAFDFETMHSYAGGMLPSNQLDTTWIADTNTVVGSGGSPTKPIIATECGYHTADQGEQPGVSERAQGKYIPRLFGEYFNRGVVRTFTYEFADEHDNLNDEQSCWGIIRYDGAPKPAFFAEKSLIALLSEDRWDAATQKWVGPKFTPGSLKLAIAGSDGPCPAYVHHTLLEKSSGVFYLLLWQEVYSYDIDARRDIDNPPAPIRLIFGQPIKSVSLFRLGTDTGAPQSLPVVQEGALVEVPDEVVIAKIIPAGATGQKSYR